VQDRIKIIVNPVSGRGKALRLAEGVTELLRGQGCTVDLQKTLASGDAKRLAAESQGFGVLAATGGDGTVNEVLNGLPLENPPALAMLPSGTANVLAKELRLPRTIEGLSRVLREGRDETWDLAVERNSGRRFLLFASAGYDAHVVRIFHEARTGPIRMWQYLWWGLKSIFLYDIPRIAVEIDGDRLTTDASWVLLSQVSCYGGPLVFTPLAKPGSGAFEVMVVKGRSRWTVLRIFAWAFWSWMTGCKPRPGGVSFHRGKRVRLSSPDGQAVPLQVDGDPGGHLPGDFELVPGALKVRAPAPKP
jgi:YegS/Rv2252/BmrU family lipid kinase